MSETVLTQQETADWKASALDILGIPQAENSTSFVPTSAHGWREKGWEPLAYVGGG